MDTEVLIVGAGPTGLMLANQLGRRGIKPLLIDRHAGPATQTRALGVHARTMEIYEKLGIAGRALELGTPGTGANIWAEGRRAARVPIGDAGAGATRFPYIFILGQDDNEKIMGERLRDWGLAVQWNTELVGLAQDARGARATLRLPDGTTKEVRADWVAGCDGAKSAVRELNGIGFPGAHYEHVFFVADAEASGSMVPGEVNVYLFRKGFHLFFPMRGKDRWRLVGILPDALLHRDVGFEAVVPSLRAEAGAGLEFESCSWYSTYRIAHRAAARFRDRRCFLLGDAAHIHSPVGAQGMNTGLQDAYNLAWKLALVVQGKADAALLDTYEEERVPVARRLLATTDRAFRLVVADNALAALLRTQVIARAAAFAMGFSRVQQAAIGVISQTGIRYPSSPLSRSLDGFPGGGPRPGERFPWLKLKLGASGIAEDLFEKLDDTRFNLLVIGQPVVAPDLGDLLRIHEVRFDGANETALARAGIPRPSFYLLRPDGHIGLCGLRLDPEAIGRYAARYLHLGGAKA